MTAADLIRQNEGIRLKPYTDTAGKLTIGVGHNLTDDGLTPIQVEIIFQDDLHSTQQNLLAGIPWTANLDEVRAAVMLDLAFNMGMSTLYTFTTFLKLMAAGAYADAGDDLLNTAYATEVGKRAVINANMLRTGQWPLI